MEWMFVLVFKSYNHNTFLVSGILW